MASESEEDMPVPFSDRAGDMTRRGNARRLCANGEVGKYRSKY